MSIFKWLFSRLQELPSWQVGSLTTLLNMFELLKPQKGSFFSFPSESH